MFTSVDTSALLSQEVLCPSSPQVWLRTNQSSTRDLQHAFCSPPALGTHQSHQTSSLCGLVNIRQPSCLIVVVALILLVWLVLSSQGSTYRQWPVGLVRPQRVFKHVESTRVEWPWQLFSAKSEDAPVTAFKRIKGEVTAVSKTIGLISGKYNMIFLFKLWLMGVYKQIFLGHNDRGQGKMSHVHERLLNTLRSSTQKSLFIHPHQSKYKQKNHIVFSWN